MKFSFFQVGWHSSFQKKYSYLTYCHLNGNHLPPKGIHAQTMGCDPKHISEAKIFQ